MKDNKHEDFDWAKDKNQIERHISDIQVIIGKKGYTCIECGQEMIAKKKDEKTRQRRAHFAHHAVDVERKGKCTFSNETYRHSVAKSILQILKKIKVPVLYKYPPSGIDGHPNKIKDSEFIVAHHVEIEMTFYETKDGNVAWGKNIDFESDKSKHLLIRPDVSFFDINNKPILLIEIVATHKLDENKLFKIRSLGIDTVEVKIPRESPKEIENTFLRTENTEWVYNYEQERREYIRISRGSNEILSLDNKFQRGLFKSGESFECKKAGIKNLIRRIEKCLGTEQFRIIKETSTKELQRTEENTERNRIRLRELQEGYKREIEKEFESETVRIDGEEIKIAKSEGEFSDYYTGLEKRYFKRRGELEESYYNYESTDQLEVDRIEEEIRELEIYGLTIEERIDGIRRDKERVESSIIYTSNEIDKEERSISGLEDRTRELSRQIIQESEKHNQDRDRIEREFNRNREDLFREFESQDFTGTSSIRKRIKEIVDGGTFLGIIKEGTREFVELRNAQKHIKSDAWRNWD
jgi:hypothetical protein